ncbi:TetR/AcrR family transcriptional regulator [Nocardia neocaledoniensis]|uniref:TetR/AcrR family transcriptional regulator n=1 Tax=Nocardia neocaledoniensis TaxID=236511 RepID=UPI002457D13D|nr:TetR/AcrR family transcriptional regulator [Nocardia neocaledoniensis]
MTTNRTTDHPYHPASVSALAAQRHADREWYRRRIILAADEAFTTNGYHATFMDEIGRRVGVSKPVLYNYFTGKLELYLAVLQTHLDNLVAGVRSALGAAEENAMRVSNAVSAYFDFVDKDTAGYRLVFDSDLISEPSVQWRTRQATEACIDAVCAELLRGSSLSPKHTRAMAVGLVGASHHAARYWIEAGRPVPKADAVAATASLCWGGLSGIDHRAPTMPLDAANAQDESS